MLAAQLAIAGAAAPPRGAPASAALASRLRALSVAPACMAARPRRAAPARRRARAAAAGGGADPPPPGADELEGESALVRAAIAAADNSLASLRGNLTKMESQTKELRAELARALREELPGAPLRRPSLRLFSRTLRQRSLSHLRLRLHL
jgi:hypothetical protein